MTWGAPFEPGERVLLVDSKDRRHVVTLATGKQFHSHAGSISHDELIGAPEGVELRTSGGSKLLAFRPALADFILKMKRGAQVVYPKDAALIVMYADIYPGATVIEAGTGSGSLTLALARAVGAHGQVISYEMRDDHRAQAAANLEAWYQNEGDKPENVELRSGDIFEGMADRGATRMVLDLPEPWRAVGAATESLVEGGILCCYLPTVPQVAQTVEAMRCGRFALMKTFEALIRTWNVDGPSVRPDHRMVAHTGFIVTARKLAASHVDTRR